MMRLLLVLFLISIGCNLPQSKKDSARLDQISLVYESGDSTNAIVQLKEYLTTYPEDDLAWTILGHAYRDEDQIDDAQAAYTSATQINPENVKAITGLGIVHRYRGDYDAAMLAYQKAVDIDKNYAQAYSSMTTISLKRRQDADALEYAKIGYNLDPTDPIIAANLAVAYHYNKDVENRDKMTKIAEELGYTNLDALNRIFSGELTVRD